MFFLLTLYRYICYICFSTEDKTIELTEKQDRVFLFIQDFIDNEHYPSSIREVAEHFRMTVKGAYDHIKAIEKKGYIRRDPRKARGIVILRGENVEVYSTP